MITLFFGFSKREWPLICFNIILIILKVLLVCSKENKPVVVVQSPSCVQLCDPMDCSTSGFPVPHHLLKSAQVHVHCISDAIQPSHPLTPSSSALNLSQHQGLLQWVVCSHQMTKILELQLQPSVLSVSTQGWFPLRSTSLINLLYKGLSGVFSSTTVWRHQSFGALPSLWFSSYNRMGPLGRP